MHTTASVRLKAVRGYRDCPVAPAGCVPGIQKRHPETTSVLVLASLVEIHLCDPVDNRIGLGIVGIGEEGNVPDVRSHALMRELA